MQTCVEEVENAEYGAQLKTLLSMRVEDPVDEELDPRSRLREYVDSKRRFCFLMHCGPLPRTTQICSYARFLEGQPLFTPKPYRIQT